MVMGICVLMASLLLTGGAWADASFTRTSEVKLAGALGTAVSMMAKLGGAPSQTVERVFVQEGRMRTDEGDNSTIMDIDAKRMVVLHHRDKTYTEFPFGMYRNMLKSRLQAAPTPTGAPQEYVAQGDEGEVQVEVDFDVEVTPTGRTKKLKGHKKEASEVLSTVTVDFKGQTQPAASEAGEEAGEAQQFEGKIIVASQLWMMKEVKGYSQVEDFNRRMGQAFLGEFEISQGQAMAMRDAFLSDPRIGEGLKKAAEEQQKIEGFEVANTTHVVLVPAGLEYDPDLVWAKKKKKKGGFGGLAAGLAKQAALAKAGAGQGEEDGEEMPAEQSTLVTVKKKLSKASTKKLDGKIFAIPAAYTKRELPMGMGAE
jgi:hypothetical protein